ncbi:P22 phage major capsid protein family protein [Rhodobium gokarnense]|uniref:P22 coat-protein 5 family protein n=1 Tax=Rhodobium gokarnense TaxID=364296 RepID=A0ABT3HH35_9HYPH|nr:P22 phage major capsid protein family protein [Rhodobium gokarnense]MCW2309716.1 hypothetical protein [Rhodobium gokarnense]
MANVLTDLAADIYKAAEIVGRNVVGYIPSVMINAGSEAAAQGDTVRSFTTAEPTLNTSVTPSMTIPEGDDQTVSSKTLVLNSVANVQIPWTGEDIKHVNNGSGYETIYGHQIQRAFNKITNQIEASVAAEAYKNASRAVGTAGTTPFASNFDLVAEARQILVDNGMPVDDGELSLILSTTAGTKLRNLAQLQKANESGGDELLRQGVLLDLQGAMMKESAQAQSHTRGTAYGSSPAYLTDTAGLSPTTYAVGSTTIHLDTGAGTHVAGDVITFSGDSNNYVIGTGSASSGDKDIVLNGPGLRETLADGVTATIANSYTANVMLHRSAMELAMRPMAEPPGGDAAVDRMVVQDDHSGLVFMISVYKGYKKAMFDITTLYQAKAWNDEAIALVLG